jgi:hypothetical protein
MIGQNQIIKFLISFHLSIKFNDNLNYKYFHFLLKLWSQFNSYYIKSRLKIKKLNFSINLKINRNFITTF